MSKIFPIALHQRKILCCLFYSKVNDNLEINWGMMKVFLDTILAVNFSIKNHDRVTIKLLIQWRKVCGLGFVLLRLDEYLP